MGKSGLGSWGKGRLGGKCRLRGDGKGGTGWRSGGVEGKSDICRGSGLAFHLGF